jgi:hypothetical protein
LKLPVPRPGLVIGYGFLWSHEAEAGADESAKDRPCAIVVAARQQENGEVGVVVAPITREQPADPSASLEVPAAVCRQLGLKPERQWLRFDELNRFTWPGFDLRAIPGRRRVDYGMLPRDLFEKLKSAILQRQRARRARPPVSRD